MTNTLVLTRGIPGSGKSTWAKRWVAEDPEWRTRINRDDLRMMTQDQPVLDRMREETLSNMQSAMVEAALRAKISVVVDDTNLTARFVKEWLRLAAAIGVDVEYKDFNVELNVCIQRDALREQQGGRRVGEDVIRSFHSRFVRKGVLVPPPTLAGDAEFSWTKYTPDVTLPKAYLVDIDGTLAQMNGRGPFDWKRVGEDSPIENVIEIVKTLSRSGYEIIFMSGRDRVCMPETLAWLNTHIDDELLIAVSDLFMRAEKDMRKDSIVKHELFWTFVADKYNVVGVFDDRNQVVRMWRDIGLTVFQVADGDF